MATRPVEIVCQRCQRSRSVQIAETVNAVRNPELRQSILDGTFDRFACTNCGLETVVEHHFLYDDFERQHWVGVFPSTDEPRFDQCGRIVAETFHDAMSQSARVVASWADGFRVRVVFSIHDLREKLLCWDRGLDDTVVELLKLDMLSGSPRFVEARVRSFCLHSISDDYDMIFRPIRHAGPADPAVAALLVPYSAYQQMSATAPQFRDQYPELFTGPFVSILRYWHEPVVELDRKMTER